MKELAALAYRDTSSESRDFWKNEMAQAIREIEQMYADKLDTMKVEMESNYNLKVSRSMSMSRSSVGLAGSWVEVKKIKRPISKFIHTV